MKKMNRMKKSISMFVITILLVFGLTACQKTDNINTDGIDVISGNYMGEITAIDGNVLTVNMMGGGMTRPEKVEGEAFKGELPEGFKPGEMPEGFEAGKMPEGFEAGEMPEGFEAGETPEGFKPGEMPEGMPEMGELPKIETIEIEVSENTNITIDGESGTVSDLKVGDFIQITMDGETVTDIAVGMNKEI